MEETAVLLIDCPDRRGLVARVSGLLYEHGANILHADQHQDHGLGLFFMRVEWALNGHGASAGFDLAKFKTAFTSLAAELDMHWQLTASSRLPRVALFCSHYLHCMADLLHRWRTGELKCEIPLIVSNHTAVENLAGFYGIPFKHTPVTAATRAEAEALQLRLMDENNVDLVVLARYMQILSPDFVAQFPARIINVHHSFLPAFTGAKPYHAAHARGEFEMIFPTIKHLERIAPFASVDALLAFAATKPIVTVQPTIREPREIVMADGLENAW